MAAHNLCIDLGTGQQASAVLTGLKAPHDLETAEDGNYASITHKWLIDPPRLGSRGLPDAA